MENIIVPSWDDRFMTEVFHVATGSKDIRTHIGAVIVGPRNEVRSTGYNSFPRGLNDNVPERQKKPEKYFYFVHAEVNAIYNAASVGIPLSGCRMYTNGVPCTNCAQGIIQTGIIEVIVDNDWDKHNSKKWAEEAKRSIKMFEETRVKLRYWDGKFVPQSMRRHGRNYPLIRN